MKLCIATRHTPLALAQTDLVAQALKDKFDTLDIEYLPLVTTGDRFLDAKLLVYGGKSLFVKELQHALLNGTADFAVHSLKDMPAELPEQLKIAAITKRSDPFDAFVSNDYAKLSDLPIGARVGTSSLRRKAQLLALRPDLNMQDIRGTVGTRLKKMDDGEFDALILAAAGLKRLELGHRIRYELLPHDCLPAVGQGALAVECASARQDICEILAKINDIDTHECAMAERAFNQTLDGGCHLPIAAFATLIKDQIYLRGQIISLDGKTIIRGELTGSRQHYIDIGQQLAHTLLQQGGAEILASSKNMLEE